MIISCRLTGKVIEGRKARSAVKSLVNRRSSIALPVPVEHPNPPFSSDLE